MPLFALTALNWARANIGPAIGLAFGAAAAIALAWVVISKNATIAALRSDKRELQSKNEALTVDLTQCRANRIALEDATDRQNKAVELAAATNAGRLKALESTVGLAATNAAKARAGADRILAAQGSGDVCRDADALIMGVVQ